VEENQFVWGTESNIAIAQARASSFGCIGFNSKYQRCDVSRFMRRVVSYEALVPLPFNPTPPCGILKFMQFFIQNYEDIFKSVLFRGRFNKEQLTLIKLFLQ